MASKEIEVGVFEVPTPIGAWRAAFASSPSGQPRRRSAQETGLAVGATIVVHLGLIFSLGLDARPSHELLSRRAGSQPSPQVVHAFFVNPEVAIPSWQPGAIAFHLQALHTAIRLVAPKFGIAEPVVGNAARDVGSVATAISPVSPEYESERLRAVYRERLESHLTHHLKAALAGRSADCVARVRQSDIGEIVDVTVSGCRGGEQSALTIDIQRSAPLPPPPRADIFKADLVVRVGNQIDVQL